MHHDVRCRRAFGSFPEETEMRAMPFDQLVGLARNPANGWSIGGFGALGEFVRDADELTEIQLSRNELKIATARGAMRLTSAPLAALAWESLSSDGDGWGHNVAFCTFGLDGMPPGITPLGRDHEAVRSLDRDTWLFDLGVTKGCVRMCVRTADPVLKAALEGATGAKLLARPDLVAAIFKAQPHRVLVSPAGRIEVFQPIPPPHGLSPEGPHTHLLPRLIATGRLHSANDPLPAEWQAALSMHPPRPWSGQRGERSFVDAHVETFAPLLARYGNPADSLIGHRVAAAILGRMAPYDFSWPHDRRSRAVARIALRRQAALGCAGADAWRKVYDPSRLATPGAQRPVRESRPLAARAVAERELYDMLRVAGQALRALDRHVDDELRPLVRAGLSALRKANAVNNAKGERDVR